MKLEGRSTVVLSVWQRVCRCEKVVGNGWDHWRRSVLNSRTLIKRASQLGTRQASHKETHGREERETRFVCLCVRVWVRERERERSPFCTEIVQQWPFSTTLLFIYTEQRGHVTTAYHCVILEKQAAVRQSRGVTSCVTVLCYICMANSTLWTFE